MPDAIAALEPEPRPPGDHAVKGDTEMLQALIHALDGRVITTHDGRLIASGQPEPEFLRRRYEHAQALREIRREQRIQRALADESQGFVERIRVALGIA